MIADFLRRLMTPTAARLPPPDAQLALAAILVRLARSDGDYTEDEVARIDRILARRHGLSAFEATALRRDAEAVEREAPDTVRFTRAIKEAVPHEDRIAVVEAMWEVVLADGVRDHDEDALMRMIAPLLGITDQESALARQRVGGRAG